MNNKTYLGDGVYADFDGFHVVLTVDNGVETTNTVYLEDTVINGLLRFLEKTYGWKITTEANTEGRPA